MTTPANPLETAVKHHQAGRLQQAAEIYQQVLATNPRNVDAMHLLGLIALHAGQHDKAINLISAAIRIHGGQPAYHNSLGEACRAAGKLADAKASYLRAIDLDRNAPGAYYNLALLHQMEGNAPAAAERCRQAVALQDDYFDAHRLLATALRVMGDLAAAQGSYERALAIRPLDLATWVDLGTLLCKVQQYEAAQRCYQQALDVQPGSASVHVSLGDVQAAQGQWQAAISSYETATRLDPQSAVAEMHLGAGLQGVGELEAAIAHYRRALELAPDYKMAHYNLGTALESLSRRDEAAAEFETALTLDPSFADAHLNLGAHYQRMRDFPRALRHFDHVLARDPDSHKAHFNRALIRMSEGNLAAGWPEYEWRSGIPDFPIRAFDLPRWNGAETAGETLLVHSEQGLGDTLQFMRYAPMVRRRCAQVAWLIRPELVGLLRQSGFEDVFGDQRELPPVHCHVPLMSLPGIFGTTLQNIPADVPYLSADSQLVGAWRERLAGVRGLRVGICWQGSPKLLRDHARSVPLTEFAPLGRVADVRLISLQKVAGMEQLAALAGQFDVLDLRPEYDTETGAFMNAAAVMRNLDLVITVDTAIGHLAGALAVPVWVAVPAYADWRWFLDREDSPWYPTMRLFRQTREGDWTDVFNGMAAALDGLAHGGAVPGAATRPG